MKILFLHNNFPAQFGTLGRYLSKEGWHVTFMTQRAGAKAEGIETVVYRDREQPSDLKPHPFLGGTQKAVVTGTSAAEIAQLLKAKKDYRPDVIMAHSGWGPGMFLKDVWEDVPYIGYFEWYYRGEADDITFLSGPDRPPLERARERMRNAPILTDLAACERGIVPTAYQASQFPQMFRDRLTVMHDGIDTGTFAPGDPGTLTFGEHRFSPGDEVVTYVARGMEPYRGFPAFMEALAMVQKRRPAMRAIIVGEDRTAYGRKLASGKTYKEDALDRFDLDPSRLCFTGLLPRNQYLRVLQLSSLHVYLTVPFVLSWSSMEAMSTGCLMLGSDVAPVREMIAHGENGLLADHRDPAALADAMAEALARRDEFMPLRRAARDTILARYAMRDIYPAKKLLLAEIAAKGA